MKLDITLRNVDKKSHKSVKKTIKHLMKQHLKPQLKRFNDNLIRLHATLEQEKNEYKILSHLHLPPRKVLVAKETSDNLHHVIEEALKELARQAEKHTAKMSGRENWKRKQRRKRIKQFQENIASTPENISESVSKKSIEPLLPKFERYIKQEMAFLQANGDIPFDYPSMEDIRDEALLKVQFNWNQINGDDETLYHELIKAVHEVLTEEMIQTQLHEGDISLEDSIPFDAMDQSEAMVGEDIGEFHQPFETLHIEDIIPDNKETLPEELLENNTKQVCYQTLSNMPNQWRRMITLRYQEQIPTSVIADRILPMPLKQVQEVLAYAEQFMITSLNESGLGLIDKPMLMKLLKYDE